MRELAVLGFVSFTATVIQQFVSLPEDTKETFEYSHVLMFVTAIFYAIEIAVISRMLGFVVNELYQKDHRTEEEMYGAEQLHWYDPHDDDSQAVGMVRRGAAAVHYWWANSWFNPKLHKLKSTSALKVRRQQCVSRVERMCGGCSVGPQGAPPAVRSGYIPLHNLRTRTSDAAAAPLPLHGAYRADTFLTLLTWPAPGAPLPLHGA